MSSTVSTGLRVGLVGPLPPPAGGMANQTRQLAELLHGEGIEVLLVQVNPPYQPRWVERIKGLRTAFRLVPYLLRLWHAARRVDLFHVMANSGWSWHLFAAPAVWIAKLRRIPCIINYRGGEAEAFLARSTRWVRPTLQAANVVVVPSGFLEQIFARWDVKTLIVPNVVSLDQFTLPSGAKTHEVSRPHVVIARNLEPIYDIRTALQAFQIVLERWPEARLSVAGSGPEKDKLEELAKELGIDRATRFTGRLDRERMARLYHSADVMLNPSLVDNMPNSVLEALASQVPVVTTAVGGVPFLVKDGESALFVPPSHPTAMAEAVIRLVDEPVLARKLRTNGRAEAEKYTWSQVRPRWLTVYRSLVPEFHFQLVN